MVPLVILTLITLAALTLPGGWLAPRPALAHPNRVYIANDDHTDLIWSASEADYHAAFIRMLDYYLDQADSTASLPANFQSRFNPDGTLWLWTYEREKSLAQFARLISRIRDGHIGVPLQPLVLLYGTMPAEAVIRSMYYAGRIERRENLVFELASAMENQTEPYGLCSLWAGSGAKYSWKGVCGCATAVTGLDDRGRELYWAVGPDGRRLLMKWHSLSDTSPQLGSKSQSSGGYAEAFFPDHAVDFATTDVLFLSRYPYPVAGLFGKGWDFLETETTDLVKTAQLRSTAGLQVIVSNEVDFFHDLEATVPAGAIPSFSGGFGMEWDMAMASLAEVSASVKRSVEKLRTAEALESLVELADPSALAGREALRDSAMMYLGLYYEHDVSQPYYLNAYERPAFERRCAAALQTYVDGLQADALQHLGGLIANPGDGSGRIFVFNPLGWSRTDFADLPTAPLGPYTVIDLSTGAEVRSQEMVRDGRHWLRILAADVPPFGYKVYQFQSGTPAFADSAAHFSAGGSTFENDRYRVTLGPSGAIGSLIDKRHGAREWVQGGGALNDLGVGSGSVAPENVGPVSATLLVTAAGDPPHRTRVTLYNTIDRVDIDNEVTGNFGRTLAYGFGFNTSGYTVRHEEVGAIATAKYIAEGGNYSPANSRYDYFTMNHFVDLSEASRGVTLSNWDSQVFALGNSSGPVIDETTPLVQAVVGGKLSGYGFDNQDGDTYFENRYALRGHDAYDQAAAMRFALEHQNPLVGSAVTTPAGSAAPYPEKSFSLLSLADPSVALWAAKPAEEGIDSGLILRVWNVDQVARDADIEFDPSVVVQGALKTSHIETDIGPVTVGSSSGGVTLADRLPAQWMQTYRVKVRLPLNARGPGGGSPPSPDRIDRTFPNPFNPGTTIAFVLGAREHVQLTVYDVRGRAVATLLNEVMDEGFHSVVFDAHAFRLPSGTYFCRLVTPEFTGSRAMTLVK